MEQFLVIFLPLQQDQKSHYLMGFIIIIIVLVIIINFNYYVDYPNPLNPHSVILLIQYMDH